MNNTTKIQGLRELSNVFKELGGKEAIDVIQAGFSETGQDILVDSQRRLTDGGSRVTGKLFRSGRVTKASGQIGVNIEYVADYAHYVEFGRKAGRMPPINSILQWVKKKGFYSQSSLKTKRRSTTKAGRKAQEGAAWAIAKSIARKGTKARPFLYPAYQAKQGNLAKNIRERFEAYIKSIKA